MISGVEAGDPLASIEREVNLLARHRNPGLVSWARARQAILAAADFVRYEAGELEAPIQTKPIRETRRIWKVTLFGDNSGPVAALIPDMRGFHVKMRRGRSNARYRFSVAHEIGHTFFYDITMTPPTRLLSWSSRGGFYRKEEDICFAFARELLMPRELVAAALDEIGGSRPSLDVVSRVAERFCVSREAATIRMLWDLPGFETAVALFRETGYSNDSSKEERVRRYWGRSVRHPRRLEKEVVDSVTEAVTTKDFVRLRELAGLYQECTAIEWRHISRKDHSTVFVFLQFRRSKAGTGIRRRRASARHVVPSDRDP